MGAEHRARRPEEHGPASARDGLPPRRPERRAHPGAGVSDHIRYLGHATVVIDIADRRILTDPVLTERILFIRRVTSELPTAPEAPDAVLISHAHQDHLHLPSMQLLSRDLPVVVPVGLGPLVRRWGFGSVTELAVGAAI